MRTLFPAIKPHIGTVGLFLLLSIVYCFPAMQGKKLQQSDIIQYRGMAKEIDDFRKKTGKEALWTGRMFSGMPSFMISTEFPSNVVKKINKLMRLGLPSPIFFIFFLMVGMYILLLTLKIGPLVSAIGAIAFAFNTFYQVSLEAGHNSKIMAIAFAPPILAGIILVLRNRLWLGFAVTALFLSFQIDANHFQITYYTGLLIILIIAVEFIYQIWKKKDYKKPMVQAGVLVLAAFLAATPNVSRLWSTYEHAKQTMRGGKSELTSRDQKSSGLDKDYAMRWSLGKWETATLLVPHAFGGSSHESLGKDDLLFKELRKRNVGAKQAQRFVESTPLYWGEQPFTSGPAYFGAVVCFLFVLGMFLLKGSLRIWCATGAALFTMLAWGRHLSWFTDLFFYYVPFYGKFRAPSMIVFLVDIVFIASGFAALNEIIKGEFSKKQVIGALTKTSLIVGGICGLIAFGGTSMFDFSAQNDSGLQKQLGEDMLLLIQDQRQASQYSSALRSLFIVLLTAGAVWLYAQSKLKKQFLIALVGLITLTDLWTIDRKYLNKKDFVVKRNYEKRFNPKPYNLQILNDKDLSYRVFNLTSNTFNEALTSHFHQSIGGYHPAKLIRYQDIIDYHISKSNINVLNMLNTRYVIVRGNDGSPVVQRNGGALGNAWFVKDIQWAKDADEEINAMYDFDPANTAIVDQRYMDHVGSEKIEVDSNARIQLTAYAPNKLVYDISTSKEQLAVFSEIHYDGGIGWNAYVDDQPVDHIRVNYVLRGAKVPAGNYQLTFKFEPTPYLVGEKISLAGSILLILSIAGIFIRELVQRQKQA